MTGVPPRSPSRRQARRHRTQTSKSLKRRGNFQVARSAVRSAEAGGAGSHLPGARDPGRSQRDLSAPGEAETRVPRPPADSASVSRHRQGRGTAQTDGDGCQGLPPCTCPSTRPRPGLPGPGHTRAAAPSATAWTLGSRDPGPGAGVIAPVGTVQARIPETEQNSTGVPDTPSSGPLSPPQAWGRVGEAPGGRTGRVGCGGRPGLGLHMRTGEASRGLASRQSRGQGFSLTGGPSSTLPDPAAGGVLGVVGLGRKMAGCRVRLTASARGPRCSGGPSRPPGAGGWAPRRQRPRAPRSCRCEAFWWARGWLAG